MQFQLYHSSLSHMLTQVGTFSQARGVVNFLVLRGAQLDEQVSDDCLQINVENDPPYGDKHNDLFIEMWTDDDGNPRLRGSKCTSQAAQRFKGPAGVGGAILPTYTMMQYERFVFETGKFNTRPLYRAKDGQDYLVRDADDTGTISVGDALADGVYGILIHPGSLSAGCVVVIGGWHSKEWKALAEWLETKQELFQTMIIEGLDIARWVNGNAWHKANEWCPTIAFGTRNEWVGKLQEAINRAGKYVKVDNHWGPATQEAYEKVLLGLNFPCLPHLTEIVWADLKPKRAN